MFVFLGELQNIQHQSSKDSSFWCMLLLILTSLMVLTISSSADVWKLYPSFLRRSRRYRVTSRPATSDLIMLWGMAKPSYIGTACVTPSPESSTTPVVFPVAYLQPKVHLESKIFKSNLTVHDIIVKNFHILVFSTYTYM